MIHMPLFDVRNVPEEAAPLRELQNQAHKNFYDVLNKPELSKLDHEALFSHPDVVVVRDAYDETVAKLLALLGSDAHCAYVDSDKWNMFSDYYKDRVNCRPHGHYTLAQVDEWIERQRAYDATNPHEDY